MAKKSKVKIAHRIPVSVIEIHDNWIVVEYEDNGRLQRKLVPREIDDTSILGKIYILKSRLALSMEYSEVSLVNILGKTVTIDVAELEDRLRRNGLWRKEDYRTGHGIIKRQLEVFINMTTRSIQVAALKYKEED